MSLVKIKKILGDELAQHFDSHNHLSGTHKYSRPVILDLSMKKQEDGNPSLEIIDENLQLISAHASENAILILDRKAMNNNQVYNANIIYVVVPDVVGDVVGLQEHEAGWKFPKILKRTPSIEAALEDIAMNLKRVTQEVPAKVDDLAEDVSKKANLWLRDSERRLSGIHQSVLDNMFHDPLWTYMASREIRIIGDLTHSAHGLPHSSGAMSWFVNLTGKDKLFTTKYVSHAKYHFLAMAGILQLTGILLKNGYAIEKKRSDYVIGKEIYMYTKDRHGRYNTVSLPDAYDEIIIMPISMWDKAKDEVKISPVYLVAETEQHAAVIHTLQTEHQDVFVRFVENYNQAMEHIKTFEQLADVRDTFPVQAIRLHGAKKIHLFLDLMDDAH
jgi:hypothetical protein